MDGWAVTPRLWVATALAFCLVAGVTDVTAAQGRANAQPSGVGDPPLTRPDEGSVRAAALATGRRVEVGGLRSETRQVFANPSGTFTVVAVVQPNAAAYQPSDVARGLVYVGLRGATSGACAGGFYLVRLPDLCTAGPDPAPAGVDVRRPDTAPRRTTQASALDAAVVCDGDSLSGNRVQLMYLRPSGSDRLSTLLGKFRTVAAGVDDMSNKSAQETAGTRHVRYVSDASCQVSVLIVQLSAASLATFGDIVAALRALGYNRVDRKYLLFVEPKVYCGLKSIDSDSSAGASNLNNQGPDYARVGQGCWDISLATEVAAHELGHNLGAVKLDAPHTTTRFHCTDEYDRMYGADGRYGGAEWEMVLRDQFSSGPPSYEPYRYGSSACRPVTGDWDGVGGATVGVVCKRSGSAEWWWSLRDSLSAGVPTIASFNYGNNAGVPVTGDWNGDGTATIGAVCNGDLFWEWWLRDVLTSGTPSYPLFRFGNSS